MATNVLYLSVDYHHLHFYPVLLDHFDPFEEATFSVILNIFRSDCNDRGQRYFAHYHSVDDSGRSHISGNGLYHRGLEAKTLKDLCNGLKAKGTDWKDTYSV